VVIAIDGPAGAGKSSVSRALAERLDATYLDSGAMYRCVALRALRTGADPDDPAAVVPLAEALDLSMQGERVTLDGENVSAAIRTPEVSAAASRVSVHPGVRAAMVERQRELLADGAWVAEGRDIGTVVWPGAELKVYLTATDEERARRRAAESGEEPDRVLAAQRERDGRDRDREHGALTTAPDSVEVETTGAGLDDVVEQIAAIAAERGLA
jgi:cytidylate kinase